MLATTGRKDTDAGGNLLATAPNQGGTKDEVQDVKKLAGIPRNADEFAGLGPKRHADEFAGLGPTPVDADEFAGLGKRKSKKTLGGRLKEIPKWHWDNVVDAGKSIHKGVKKGLKSHATGIADYLGRRKDALTKIMQDDISLEEFTNSANFLLEDYELVKREQLNDLRRLSGLKEDEDVWAYSPMGKGTVARVVETDAGLFQVYIMGPKSWIAQGQPHATQEKAEADAKSFWEDYNKNVEYDTARHNAKTAHM